MTTETIPAPGSFFGPEFREHYEQTAPFSEAEQASLLAEWFAPVRDRVEGPLRAWLARPVYEPALPAPQPEPEPEPEPAPTPEDEAQHAARARLAAWTGGSEEIAAEPPAAAQDAEPGRAPEEPAEPDVPAEDEPGDYVPCEDYQHAERKYGAAAPEAEPGTEGEEPEPAVTEVPAPVAEDEAAGGDEGENEDDSAS